MRVNSKWSIGIGTMLVCLYLANFVYALFSKQTGGSFGDTFGAVNALFSGSALLFLVLAFVSQREELDIVRQERNDTRKLLQGQEEIAKAQKNALDMQVFEQSFNSILALSLQERKRLAEPIESLHGFNPPILDKAADISRHYILLLSKEKDLEVALLNKKFTSEFRDVFATMFFVSSIVYLDDFVETSLPSVEQKPRFKFLIASLIDRRLANCLAFLYLFCQLGGISGDKVKVFIERYKVAAHLEDDLVDAFNTLSKKIQP